MSQVWSVARQEFRSYFDHATAYILAVAFLGLALFLTFRPLYAQGAATLRPLFDVLPWLLAVFVPAITMRSLAEERRSGTLDWVMSQPVTEGGLIVGKFLGDWLFVVVVLAGTLPTALGVLLVSEADPGIMVAQYVGAALLAALVVAIGLWASSTQTNQIAAFILAVVVSFGLILLGLQFTLIGLPPVLSAAAASLSVLSHFENIARGVIDLRDVLYFVSTTALFLVLAYAFVTGRRLSRRREAYGRLRIGTAAVFGVVLLVNLLGAHIRGRLDLTDENLFTLSEGTREVLGSMDDLVTVKLVVSSELPPEIQLTRRDVRDLLADLRRASDGMLRVRELHPDEDDAAAEEAASLGIRPIQFNVLRGDELQVKRGWFGLAIQYADEEEVIPVVSRTSDLEYRITSAVASMTADRAPRVVFLTGYQALSPGTLSDFRDEISGRYDVQTASIEPDSAGTLPELSPDSVDVVVLAGPKSELAPGAVEAIEGYLAAGGSAFFLLGRARVNPRAPVAQPITTGLEPVLEGHGVRVASELVIDLRSNERVSMGQRGMFSYVSPYPLWPRVQPAGEHIITRNLNAVTLGWASPVVIGDSTRARALFRTTDAGARRPAGSPISPQAEFATSPDSTGVQTVAAVVDPTLGGEGGGPGEAGGDAAEGGGSSGARLVVVGDSDFLGGQFVQSNPQNLVFGANAVDWLAQDEDLIGIRSKDRTPPSLVFDSDVERNALKWGNLVGIPLLFVVIGLVRVLGRRRRAEARWEEMVS